MGVTTTVPHDVVAAGVDWWGARFGDVDRVGFSGAFLPALLKSCRLEPTPGDAALSLDELRVVAKYCVADAAWQHDSIARNDFIHFLARFGPLEACAQRLVDSLTVHREMVTWFHGAITRAEAEKVLLTPSATAPLEDGAFLVRFSDSQPSRFCVSYLKIHATGPHAGRREVRNVLIENAGQAGFVLTDTRNKAYSSIRSFIQRTASRLKHGVTSSLSRRCNLELAAVRARQDLASNSYTTFSTESLEPSSTSSPSSPAFKPQHAPPSSLLFTKSPPAGEELLRKYGNNQEEHLLHREDEDENYSGFAKSSFLPRPLSIKSTAPQMKPPGSSVSAFRNGYGSFSAAAVVSHERTPPGSPARTAGRRQIPIITPPAGSDYGDFSAFTSAVTSFSRVTAPVPTQSGAGALSSSNNDEYASFESLVASGASTVAANPAPPAVSSQDTYGAFEPFELMPRSSPTVAAVAVRPPPRASVESSDDYGSFASITGTFSQSDSDRPAPRTAVPSPSSTSDSSDVYGTFSLSPNLKPQASSKSSATTSVSQPLALGAAAPRVVLASRPPTSLPSDTYGSFDALTLADPPQQPESLQIPPAPHSAPADMTPLAAAEHEEVESSVSALDELNAGMEFYKQKLLDDALLRFIGAREAAQRSQDLVVEARALGNLGTVYLDKQKPQQAVLCYEQCLEIMRSVQDVKRERLILNNLVLALMAAEDWVSAYNYCQIQLETTVSDVNRRKILTRMSELRERAARASREARSSSSRLASV